MYNKIRDALEYVLLAFGFDNIRDYQDSLFGGIKHTHTLIFCSVAGVISTIVHDLIGLEAKVYVALIGLFLLEFTTGVYLSVSIQKKRFNAHKLGRIVIKMFVYTGILILFNTFKEHLGGMDVIHLSFNFFEWIYYIILNLLILQLAVAVFENLEDCGWKEAALFTKLFKKKLDTISDIEEEEAPKEIIEEKAPE